MRRILFLFVLLCVLGSLAGPGIVLAQEEPPVETPIIEVPETLEDAKEQSFEVGEKIAGILPGVVSDLWKSRVLPVWQNIWVWAKETLWEGKVGPVAQNWANKAKQALGREVQERKPIIEQELQQEKQELADDVARFSKNAQKSLWERFLGLFREKR